MTQAVSTSPFIMKILSIWVPARRASITALRPSMIPSAGASSPARSGRGWLCLYCIRLQSRRVGRRKKFQGKKAENLHILGIISWISGKKKPLSREISGERIPVPLPPTTSAWSGGKFHKFLTPMSQAVPCNKKGNMIPYRYQMGKFFPANYLPSAVGYPARK